MSGPLRSKQGCWTCRLRRKKCDERREVCSVCESLGVTCYGYGPKPEWMDGGEREKAVAASIKQVVKHTSRRKGRLGTSLGRFSDRYGGENSVEKVVRIAPKTRELVPDAGGSHESVPAAQGPMFVTDSPLASTHSGNESLPPAGTSSSSPPAPIEETSCGAPTSSALVTLPISEAVLLMHFLDNVFPLQHPMYRPGVAEGGRGWLLALLLRTKPLYHASLALSAYHRGTVLLAAQRHSHSCSSAEQEQHLAICLNEFQRAIKDVDHWVMKACPRDGLGLMASIVQLIYFELFAGHGHAWKIHLRAATATFASGYWNEAAQLGLIEQTEADTLPLLTEQVPSPQLASFKFLSGVILWLDILETVTTGKEPCLLSIHPHALNPKSHIRLESIIGCSNWPIVQIGRIAALYERKVRALRNCCLDEGLHADVESIRRELQYGLTEQTLACLAVSHEALAPHNSVRHRQALITRLFALAASIYLDLVVHGFQQGAANSVTEAMTILRSNMPSELLHTVIFPLYLIGYVAAQEDQPFFRGVFSSPPVLDPSLEHRSKILPLLEDIWQNRDAMLSGGSWEDSLRRLSDCNLLLL
ncbi:unnamed protein product [Diplocarpon coronariae]